MFLYLYCISILDSTKSKPLTIKVNFIWVLIQLLTELCPLKIHTLKSHPQTSECDLIWRQDFYSSNYFKMRLLGYTLIQYDWCHSKKRKCGHRQGQMGGTERRQLSTNQRGRPGTEPSLMALRRNQSWFLGLPAFRTVRKEVSMVF